VSRVVAIVFVWSLLGECWYGGERLAERTALGMLGPLGCDRGDLLGQPFWRWTILVLCTIAAAWYLGCYLLFYYRRDWWVAYRRWCYRLIRPRRDLAQRELKGYPPEGFRAWDLGSFFAAAAGFGCIAWALLFLRSW